MTQNYGASSSVAEATIASDSAGRSLSIKVSLALVTTSPDTILPSWAFPKAPSPYEESPDMSMPVEVCTRASNSGRRRGWAAMVAVLYRL
jgi:hypothetical protein